MLYNYKEIINTYKTDYKIKKAVSDKLLFKIEKGIYSDGEDNYTEIELVLKKYSNAFLVKESALYFYNIINQAPEKIHIGTARNALRIHDARIIQHFYSGFNALIDNRNEDVENDIYLRSTDFSFNENNIFTSITDNENEIRILYPQMVIFDLLRDSRKYSLDELKVMLNRFIDCPVLYDFDAWKLEDEFYEKRIPYDYALNGILEEISHETFHRQFERRFEID